MIEPPSGHAEHEEEKYSDASRSKDDRSLVMVNPDAGAAYALDPGLPREAQRITVSARPGADTRLVEVTLLVDGQPLVRLGEPPYEVLWKLEPGRHVFTAMGVADGGNQVASDEVWIDVRE